MDNIVAWNIRGLNWPNKQVDVHIFLQTNIVGLVGPLETKVKEKMLIKWQCKSSQAGDGCITSPWIPRGGYG